MKIGKNQLIVAAVVLIAVLGGWWLTANHVKNTGNQKEAFINGLYPKAQNSLSNCEAKTSSAANVAGAQAQAVDKILIDAVKGRYSQPSSPQIDSGKLFSALREDYPNLTQVSKTFQDVLAIVAGCRDDFAGSQNQLIDALQKFDSWRTGSFTVRTFGSGFPNHNLVARLGSDAPLRGQPAEDKMWQIVLTSTTLKEYKSGTLDQSTLTPFGTATTG